MQASTLTLGNITRHTNGHLAFASRGPQLAGLQDDRSLAGSERHHSRRSSDSLASSDLSALTSLAAPLAAGGRPAESLSASTAGSTHRSSYRRRSSKPDTLAAAWNR